MRVESLAEDATVPGESSPDLRSFVSVMQDHETYIELCKYCVSKLLQGWAEEGMDKRDFELFELTFNHIAKLNSREVFDHAESPIELIFINSLFLGSIKNGHPLLILHPAKDIEEYMREYREALASYDELMLWYKNTRNGLSGIHEYFDNLEETGNIDAEERSFAAQYFVCYYALDFRDKYHLILQPGFPQLRVNNRSIRSDILVWVPARKDFKLVVECDGYEYHSDRRKFESDRKRDRLLKDHGYDVRRYAGSEIVKNPMNTSYDLLEYLLDRQTW